MMKSFDFMKSHGLGIQLLVLAAIFLAVPCPAVRAGKNDPAAAEKIGVRVTLDKAVYRPGEAVLATVQVTNHTREPYDAFRLNTQSLVFVFGRQSDPERMERRAVASDKEPKDEVLTLLPGKPEKRAFVLTRLTEFSGAMVAQVHYAPGGMAAAKINPRLYSNTVVFRVEGARAFRRDPEAFIVKDEALRLARAAAGGRPETAQAVFARDEMGFYKWYVNVKPEGAAAPSGWLIDPYRGAVWRKARPFDPKLALDPRFQRPANLPKTALPARMRSEK